MLRPTPPASSPTRSAVRLAVLAVTVGLALPLLLPPRLGAPAGPSVRVLDQAGRLLREVRPAGALQPVRLADVPPFAIDALVATEDRRFLRHPGVDPFALARAAVQNAQAGRTVSGGSTLPMQLARMLRAGDGPETRGLRAKLAEAHLAVRLDLWHPKDALLEAWLARAPFGRQTRGLTAAAQLYFGKSPAALTQAEAALLVGLPQSPSLLDPYRHPERARQRQRRVLRSMVGAGRLTADESDRIGALPLDFRPPSGRFLAPHYVDHLLASGTIEQSEGGVLRTTLDLPLQREAERVARSHVARLGRERVGQVAAVVLENATGATLAYVGSADYFDAAAGGQNDGARALRQPGSTLKPFTYAAAIERLGYGPATILPDRPDAVAEAGGAFVPANYDGRYHGDVALRRALASSYNVPAVVAAERVGLEALLAFYRDAGFASLDKPAGYYGAAMTLGAGEVRLVELAQAYALLARCATGGRCARLDGRDAPFSPATAALLTDVLADPDARESAFGRGSALELPFPVAVKTGTSKDYRDTWAVGYSPTHTVAVWAGNFSGAPMREVSGVSGAAPVLAALFREVGAGGGFPAVDGVETRTVCPASGHRHGPACPSARAELFRRDAPPLPACALHAAPPTSMPVAAEQPAPRVAAPRAPTLPTPAATDGSLAVAAPRPGAVYTLDPVLRAGYQRVAFRAHVPPGMTAATFVLDGAPVGPADAPLAWALQPGRHVLAVHARDRTGRSVASAPVSFHVRGRASTAALPPLLPVPR